MLGAVKDCILILDDDLNVVYSNKLCAKIIGFKQKSLKENQFLLQLNESYPCFQECILSALKEQKIQRFEWKSKSADSYLETTIYPIDKGVIICTKDITEQKLTSDKLTFSNQRLELILSISNQLLSNTTPQVLINGICQKVMAFLNCSVFFNYLVDQNNTQLLHLNAYAGISPELAKNLEWLQVGQAPCGYAIKQGRRIIWESICSSNEERIAILRANGLRVYVANPFFSHKKVIGCLSFGSKIKDAFSTEELSFMAAVAAQVGIAIDRKRTEDALVRAKDELTATLEKSIEEKTMQLRDAERLAAIGATAGMVGHDIRNPLQAMMGDTYLLKEELIKLPESKIRDSIAESVESIEKNITYINKIVADLQDYAKPLKPEFYDTNVLELVTGVFAPITIPENINPQIEVNKDLKLKSDPLLLRRILTNLIINAMQAMPDGGQLTIDATKDRGITRIFVEDTGVGIPEAVKPKLFTPMVTTKAKGQGLGLAVVKRLIEALNGQVTFESQEGKGTKFIITVPESP